MISFLSLSAMSGAFLLLAHSATKSRNKRRAYFFGFLALLAFGLGGRILFANEGFWDGLTLLVRDLGIGLVLGGGLMASRKSHAAVLLYPGVLVLGLAAGLWGVTGVASWIWTTPETAHIQGEALVELGPDDILSEIEPILKKFDATAERAFPSVSLSENEDLAQYYVIKAEESRLPELMAALRLDKENVDQVDWNYEVKLSPQESVAAPAGDNNDFLANDPHLKDQWGLVKSQAHALHRLIKESKPKKRALVAIVDTGVDVAHEDLAGVGENSPGGSDKHGHGTHCAGIAAAATNNKVGVGSFNWDGKFVRIRGYKALSDSGSGSLKSVCDAIIAAAKDNADVISMSLGGYHPTPPKAEVDAINFALKRGCIVIVAAGNSNAPAKNFAPANVPGVICVAALNQDMNKANFSNTNDSVKQPIAAPGVAILSLKTGGGYVSYSGTSMATPMVSGIVGVMRSLHPELTPKQAYAVLHESGMAVPDSAKVGRAVNAVAAVNAVR